MFDGSAALYWVLVVGVLAYAVELLRARLAGRPLALRPLRRARAAGVLLALPVRARRGDRHRSRARARWRWASRRRRWCRSWSCRGRCAGATRRRPPDAAARRRARRQHALRGAVLVIMAAEQALLNGPVVAADVTSTDAALAGFVFNVLLITRAPLQLFQAIQTSLLPHLSGLAATDGGEDFARALRVTLLAIAGFAGAVVLGLAADRPVGDGPAVRRRLRLRPRRARAGRPRDGLPPRRRGRSTRRRWRATARAWPPPRGWAARRCSSAGCSPRRSTTSCWRSRSATAPPPRCSRSRCG